jgi:hypothetical protein
MSKDKQSTTDQILDLLLDALQERKQSREDAARPTAVPKPSPVDNVIIPAAGSESAPVQQETAVSPSPAPDPLAQIAQIMQPKQHPPIPREDVLQTHAPQKLPSIYLEKMLGKLMLVLFVLLIVVNIPFNRFGTSLARAMPDTAALIVRDGLVIKGSGAEIFVLENNQKRWITTIDAFEWYGYRWEQVRQVDEAFLAQFENGRPIYLLLKCSASPHVYALENGEKRWIKDIPTFTAQGFEWEDIKFINCNQLRNMPDGLPIPPDAGPPPQP